MAKVNKKNKKIVQSKNCVGCGICASVCPINTKLMKNDDFDPETTELAIRIIDVVAILSDEIGLLGEGWPKTGGVESHKLFDLGFSTA